MSTDGSDRDGARCRTGPTGGLDTEFEQRPDGLLADLSPEWRAPALPEPYGSNERFVAYNRRNAKRRHLGNLLVAQPDVAAAAAERVLDAIACDEDVSFNRQLIRPTMNAVGRRAVVHATGRDRGNDHRSSTKGLAQAA